MHKNINVVWFRKDLRLKDNPALVQASKNSLVFPIYIHDDDNNRNRELGAASKVWLYNSLKYLNKATGYHFNYFVGNPYDILLSLLRNENIKGVYWNRCYEPYALKRDKSIKAMLKNNNVTVKTFNGSLVKEPWEVLKDDNTPYRVFTPFFRKAYLSTDLDTSTKKTPDDINYISNASYNSLDSLNLLSNMNWENNLLDDWKIGEEAALFKADDFLTNGILDYKDGRNFPYKSNVSRLSPHLHFGEISPKRLWTKTLNLEPNKNTHHFLSEICWREFSYYLLYHFPSLPKENLQTKFNTFPWQNDNYLFEMWKKGKTGYPIIDAGMKELYVTGYMHNRVRMIVASFLVKNLLVHWRRGEEYFWDCLFDADLANNCAGWQWVAGSGADAAPYFRIFNPITQGKRFDENGDYIKKYLPELKDLPKEYIFNPWEAPSAILDKANVKLGVNYPLPIIDIKESRERALKAYKEIK
jgi:deoxyribodipyrimidine photo-lyase